VGASETARSSSKARRAKSARRGCAAEGPAA